MESNPTKLYHLNSKNTHSSTY